ncbi:MAG TPA: BON domain-containing protein [Kofleriaceae bacterium]|nr:BON domain-containing protein [Kofleriaceae bacterium]
MKSDTELKHDVEGELAWDVQIDATAIGVAAHHGVVTLTGTVSSWADKHAVEEAAYRVHGVGAIANEIEIKPSWETGPTDSELAEQVRLALEWDPFVASERIRATVCDRGSVTLAGAVATLRERDEAERVVRGISGIRFVTNEIAIETPPVAEAKLRNTIEQALARHAARAAQHVTVAVDGDTVVLEGLVGSWPERRAVIGAARGTPGVKRVEDHLYFI